KNIRKNFNLAKNAEITVEANPFSAAKKTLKTLKRAGVNRLSIGVQSANESELKKLGRLHSFSDFEHTYKTARLLKFKNISVDIMYGIPDQTWESLCETLDKIIALAPEHISLYGLKIEEGTPFFEARDRLALPDEDTEADMYFAAAEKLEKAGYNQYEISNFAKNGYECKHNLKYWNCDEYLGLGTAASSYLNGRRFSFVKDIKLYNKVLLHESGENILSEYLEVPQNENIGEYVMLRFRLNDGISKEAFRLRFHNKNFDEMFYKKLEPFIKSGHVEITSDGYAFNRKGFYISNYILARILDF
ncbi:MAG: radical SAM family heme chaperone HemW, partial [Bacillota bacterium]|nr:radical SAM family heme chaperone HemW [Bacillota bacterium]